MTVTIARYQDRIPTDKTAEEAAAIHGPGAVFVDGKCYADILAAQDKQADAVVEEAAAVEVDPERRIADNADAEQYVGERAGDVHGS